MHNDIFLMYVYTYISRAPVDMTKEWLASLANNEIELCCEVLYSCHIVPASSSMAGSSTGVWARVYADVNSHKPRDYWDYESHPIEWG